ncbi:protein-export chaperone SecB [Salegentibacter sp. Hel_I_6]|uniref:protein-export chaperone SecB n=1 Tax=Salegentibacter sp. Hel_I_6 TaxID=1250278 RepID=UPI00055B301B|nr:protein-export chaperone SecB [Salegentibacter sp. Hel_I_6]
MQIRLGRIQFTNLDYQVDTYDPEVTHELETSFGIGSSFASDNNKAFAVNFDIKLKSADDKFRLNLKATAHFSTEEDIDDDFQKSSFVSINAPAIAFPYVRTYISNLTLNSGYDPIILPSINFVQLASQKDQEDQSNQQENSL